MNGLHIHVEDEWLKHNGVNIAYQRYTSPSSGKKPALVFVHGFLSSKFCYRFMIPELLEHFDVFSFDYPPFGNSDKNWSYKFSYSNFAHIIIELMDQHHIQKASIAGHSMGGQVALTCSHLFPERIDKLILMAPSTYMKKLGFWLQHASRLPVFPFLLKRHLYKKGVYHSLLDCVHDPHMINKEMIQGYMKPFFKEEIFRCLSKMIRDREGDLTSQYLREIEASCLVFWGKEDKVLPVSLGYRLVKDLPSAELEVFEQSGHLLPEEVPSVLTEKIKQFCLPTRQATS
ncbi:alpha/beta hydrolase [Pontibacillus salipaludis]|uniref:alpha/beta fold hydrolase n=1 Tax=Pontibacillus salipaludis TaxID=1697394 RepID=UPI0031E9B992